MRQRQEVVQPWQAPLTYQYYTLLSLSTVIWMIRIIWAGAAALHYDRGIYEFPPGRDDLEQA